MDCLRLPFIRLEEAVLWTQRFLTRKIWPNNEVYLWQTNPTFQVNTRKIATWKRRFTSRNRIRRHFCQHFVRRTTQQTFSAINLASQQKKTKLFFSSQVRKQFKLLAVPLKSLRCCLRSGKLVNCHVWKFCKDLFLSCRVSGWPDLSIKSYFLMVSSLILLRSLRVYILKQLFFSISVNSGFRNIYLATSWLGKYFATMRSRIKSLY